MEEKKSLTDRLIDSIFNMKKITFYLIILFIIGFILRFIAATNLPVSPDDMHSVTHAINFFFAGRLITYDQSAGLWFSFASIMYKLLGTTQLASRFAALIFGSLTILILYLFCREFFDEKTSLIAALILTFSPFHIKSTMAEMDVMAMFFSLTGMLLFIRALKTRSTIKYIFSGTLFGLAIYTKVYPLLFIPSLLLYFVYYQKKNNYKLATKENFKKISVFLIPIFIFCIPTLAHNFLLYKHQGFLDLQFSRSLGLGKDVSAQYYAWDHQFTAKNDWKGLFLGNSVNYGKTTPTLLAAIDFIRILDPVVFFLGILGLLYLIFTKKNKNYVMFFLLSILFILPFLASILMLSKHYLFLSLFLMPFSSKILIIITKIFSKIVRLDTLKYILIIIILINLFVLGLPSKHFYGESYMNQIIEFKEDNIPKDSLIVGDSRIYRGSIHWAFHGWPYFEATNFLDLMSKQEVFPGDYSAKEVYFFECVPDDCGWGTIKDQPEFNQTMESLVAQFQQKGILVETIYEPYPEKSYYPFSKNKREIIKIYKTNIQLKTDLSSFAKQSRTWFLYPIGYSPETDIFDLYNATSFSDILIDKTAHLISLIALILAFLSPIFVIYLVYKRK